jgi:dihydrofolate synthase/folylpolyglutamate synthase
LRKSPWKKPELCSGAFPAVIAPQSEKALKTLAGFAAKIGAEAAFLRAEKRPSLYRSTNLRGGESHAVVLPGSLSLKGARQFDNAAAAVECITAGNRLGVWRANDDSIAFGLQNAVWPARLQLVATRRPHILLDVAHNPDGIEALTNYLDDLSEYPLDKRVGIIGILADKDVKSMLKALESVFSKIILAKPLSDRASEPSKLLEFIADKSKVVLAETPSEALSIARAVARRTG